MSIQPTLQQPVVERSGVMTRVWYVFLSALARLPTARLSGSTAYNPASIAASGTTTQTVTVTGAVLGWQADASFSLDLAGLMMTAYVSAADTVTVVLFNPTAGAVDLGAGTLRAFAWQP